MPTIDPNQFFKSGNVKVINSQTGQMDSIGSSQTPNQSTYGNKPSTLKKIESGLVNYGKNLVGDFKTRGQNIISSVEDAGNKKQSVVSAGLQTAGQVAGSVGDIISRTIQPVTDKTVKPVIEKIAHTETAQNGLTKYTEWARQHPEASRNLEAAVNIAGLLGGEKPINKAASTVSTATTNTAELAAKGAKNAVTGSLETAGEAANTLKNGVKPVTQFGSKMVVGEDLHGALTHFADNVDNVNAFRTGTKTHQSIADSVMKAHDTFDARTFKEFQGMKKGLPEIKVPNSNVIGEVKKIVSDSPTLLPKEKDAVQSAIDLIKTNKDQSLKGILDMRNRLDRSGLIRGGEDYINSNKVINKMRGKLNDMAIERAKNYDLEKGTNYHVQIMQGLKKAQSSIDLLDRMNTNLIGTGKNVEQTANNIRRIIGKIDDPTQYEATKNLLKEIEGRTGVKLVNDLESAKTAEMINKSTKLKGGFSPLKSAGELVNKGAVKGVEKYGSDETTPSTLIPISTKPISNANGIINHPNKTIKMIPKKSIPITLSLAPAIINANHLSPLYATRAKRKRPTHFRKTS